MSAATFGGGSGFCPKLKEYLKKDESLHRTKSQTKYYELGLRGITRKLDTTKEKLTHWKRK
jgi:hypothetical protein